VKFWFRATESRLPTDLTDGRRFPLCPHLCQLKRSPVEEKSSRGEPLLRRTLVEENTCLEGNKSQVEKKFSKQPQVER
jgi:hypothetical protein